MKKKPSPSLLLLLAERHHHRAAELELEASHLERRHFKVELQTALDAIWDNAIQHLKRFDALIEK